MCYNGSVHYWRVTRVLQRDGVRVHLLPSMEQIVKVCTGNVSNRYLSQRRYQVARRKNIGCRHEMSARWRLTGDVPICWISHEFVVWM